MNQETKMDEFICYESFCCAHQPSLYPVGCYTRFLPTGGDLEGKIGFFVITLKAVCKVGVWDGGRESSRGDVLAKER